MVEEIEYMKIAAGSYHSCMIANVLKSDYFVEKRDKTQMQQIDRLYVWGLNNERHLADTEQTTLDFHMLELKCDQREYEPISVASGPNFSVVIGRINSKQEEKYLRATQKLVGNPKLGAQTIDEILNQNNKTDQNNQKQQTNYEKITKQNLKLIQDHFGDILRKSQNKSLFANGGFSMGDFKDLSKYEKRDIGKLDPQEFKKEKLDRQLLINLIKKTKFVQKTEFGNSNPNITLQHDEITDVITLLMNHSNHITIGQFEDFCLNFQQDSTKLFIFGKCDYSLVPEAISVDGKNPQSDSEEEAKYVLKPNPAAIQFERFARPIEQVACGQAHILAVNSLGKLYSWGQGHYGALGFGDTADRRRPTELEIKQEGILAKIWKVACGKMHSMCLTDKKQIYSWGQGQSGKLGHGNEDDIFLPKEVSQLSNLRVIDISAGEAHSAAVTQSKKLYTWGNGFYGRLGTGYEIKELYPTLVVDLSEKEVVRVSCGAFHTMALTQDGKLWAFGNDKYGKLGLGTKETSKQSQPLQVKYIKEDTFQVQRHPDQFCQIVAGQNHSMALIKQDKCTKLLTWGYNGYNLLGRKTDNKKPMLIDKKLICKIPKLAKHLYEVDQYQRDVTISTKVQKIAAGHCNTLILLNGGELYICGSDRQGQKIFDDDKDNKKQQGEEKAFKQILEFVKLQAKVKTIACGGEHMIAVLQNNKVFGWGRNDKGQLGLGSLFSPQRKPIEIDDLGNHTCKDVVCGADFSVMLTENKTLLVAGSMEFGKLGLSKAHRDGYQQTFAPIPELKNVNRFSCGTHHMIAICNDNTYYAWGRNDRGQLGIGNKITQYKPVQILFSSFDTQEDFVKIECGRDFSIGLNKNKNVFVWGNRKYLGPVKDEKFGGKLEDAEEPQRIMTIKDVTDIYCCDTYALILQNSNIKFVGHFAKNVDEGNRPRKAGINDSKFFSQQKEDNSSSSYSWELDFFNSISDKESAEVTSKIKNLSLSPFHVVVLTKDSLVYSWGLNDDGQLGISAEKGFEKEAYIKKIVAVDEINNILKGNKNRLDQLTSENQNKQQLKKVRPSDDTSQQIEETKSSKSSDQSDSSSDSDEISSDYDGTSSSGSESSISSDGNADMRQKMASRNINDRATMQQARDPIKPADVKVQFKRDEKPIVQAKPQPQPQPKKPQKYPQPGVRSTLIQPQLQRPEQETALIAKEDFQIKEDKYLFEQEHLMLQKELKQEDKAKLSEKSMFEADRAIIETIQGLLKKSQQLYSAENERRQLKTQIKCSFMQRINEKPFSIKAGLNWPSYYYSQDRLQLFKQQKRQLKSILTLIHVHPCYLQNLYFALKKQKDPTKSSRNWYSKEALATEKQFESFLKLVYPTDFIANVDSHKFIKKATFVDNPMQHSVFICQEKERVNLLLISFAKKIVEQSSKDYREKQRVKGQNTERKYRNEEEIDFSNNIVGLIFRRVLMSQEANIDTIASFASSVIDKYIQKYAASDDAEVNAQTKKGQNTALSLKKKTQELFDFVEQNMIEALHDNQLSDNNLNIVKQRQQHKKDANKLPAFRFSDDVNIFLRVIYDGLLQAKFVNGSKEGKNSDETKESEKFISKQILSLIFKKTFRKMVENFEIYLFPYLSLRNSNSYIDSLRGSKGELKQDLKTILEIFEAFISDGKLETQYNQKDVLAEFENILDKLITKSRNKLMYKIMESRHPLTLSYKHFENMLLHSHGFQDFTLVVDDIVVRELIQTISDNKDDVMIVSPSEYDPLMKLISAYISFSERLDKKRKDKLQPIDFPQSYYLKIKSRLLLEDKSQENDGFDAQSCPCCEVVLTSNLLVSESHPILKTYDPEDQEQLFSLYGQVLKRFEPLQENVAIWKQLENSKRTMQLKNDKDNIILHKFVHYFDEQVSSRCKEKRLEPDKVRIYKNNMADKQVFNSDDNSRELAQYEIYKDIKNQLINQINIRRHHYITIHNTQERIENFLRAVLEEKKRLIFLESKKDSDVDSQLNVYYQVSTYNHQLGIGNHELKPIYKIVDSLITMRDILRNQEQQQFSYSLFQVLQEQQKLELRAIKKESALKLKENKTIRYVLPELKALLPMCSLLVTETERREVNIKLIYEEQSKSCVAAKSKLKKQQLLYNILMDQQAIFRLRMQVRQYQFLMTKFYAESEDIKDKQGLERLLKLFKSQRGQQKALRMPQQKNIQSKHLKETVHQLKKKLEKDNNRQRFDEVIEFDKSKLLGLVNQMLKNRYAYIFNCQKTPQQLVRQYAKNTNDEDDD